MCAKYVKKKQEIINKSAKKTIPVYFGQPYLSPL